MAFTQFVKRKNDYEKQYYDLEHEAGYAGTRNLVSLNAKKEKKNLRVAQQSRCLHTPSPDTKAISTITLHRDEHWRYLGGWFAATHDDKRLQRRIQLNLSGDWCAQQVCMGWTDKR